MKSNTVLYIFSNGRVAAINKKNGEIIWEVKLKQYLTTKVTMAIGQISVEENKIYVAAAGILLCLSSKDGSLIWKNELKGWGFNFVSIANVNNDVSGAAMQSSNATAVIAAT